MSFCTGVQFCQSVVWPSPNRASNTQTKMYENNTALLCKKTFLCIRKKGSYTLEAAVILPLVAAFFVALLFFFRVLQIQTQVQESLDYASRRTACEASAVSSQVALRASAEAYFRKELGQYTLPDDYVKGGVMGITLLSSDFSDSYVTLQANYYVKLPIAFFQVKGISITQNSKNHKWIGDRDDGGEADYVYVTPNGTVYHCSRSCSYLDLTIRSVNFADLSDLRNKNAHKYYACSECVANNANSGLVYITDYGTCYHTSLSCGGLKRTIYLIPLSEVGSKGPCSKCKGS